VVLLLALILSFLFVSVEFIIDVSMLHFHVLVFIWVYIIPSFARRIATTTDKNNFYLISFVNILAGLEGGVGNCVPAGTYLRL